MRASSGLALLHPGIIEKERTGAQLRFHNDLWSPNLPALSDDRSDRSEIGGRGRPEGKIHLQQRALCENSRHIVQFGGTPEARLVAIEPTVDGLSRYRFVGDAD